MPDHPPQQLERVIGNLIAKPHTTQRTKQPGVLFVMVYREVYGHPVSRAAVRAPTRIEWGVHVAIIYLALFQYPPSHM